MKAIKSMFIKHANFKELQESEFTYENGIKSWVGVIFVDIVNSSD